MIVQYHSITCIKSGHLSRRFLKIQAKNPTPYLEIADSSNIKQDNLYNKQASFLNIYQIYVSLLSSLYIKMMFTLKYQIMKRE